MQILQWLFKISLPVQTIEITTAGKRMITIEEEKEIDYDEFEFEQGGVAHKDSIAILLTRANSRTCFHSTLNLKTLRSFYENRHSSRSSAKEDYMVHKAESAQVGGEILPICDVISSDSTGAADYNSDTSINKKRRAISRMKELLKWASTAKGGNKRWKVLYFRNRGATKTISDDRSTDSSKISLSWDVGSCSTASSSFSPPMSLASSSSSLRTISKCHLECITKETSESPKIEECIRTGNWITTDSEYVVLEL